jgi:hypothetical protein
MQNEELLKLVKAQFGTLGAVLLLLLWTAYGAGQMQERTQNQIGVLTETVRLLQDKIQRLELRVETISRQKR